ncbi:MULTISPECIES: hypothetical protein [Alicyclobacillus]|uniref:Uncharacterized protein n=1 Tax=Alicyclobacillus acidoterrestris (strain ATCC 49025 / DSM 3922 / CIP 106132 / NCIMB 13137 / GD3B) TaxID=1356854 RepID=T0BF96_ALIAG|nr:MULTISPECIES: hypothetical protein [Alicyclobacillus]EPZ42653.1 hypothetical protein N007_14550 [Alicyclobacillus acidoterrestris ATCC 49025]UNO47406.1 hypothetical protein K1I37_11805 [Alicyclobacillus acidoterrestris]
MSFQTSLTCCAILLVLPRYGFHVRLRSLITYLLLFTLLSVTLLESVVPVQSLVVLTLFIAMLHMWPDGRLRMHWRMIVIGAMTAVFEQRFDTIYPFQRLYGIPTDWMTITAMVLICVLLVENSGQVWPAWCICYVVWTALGLASHSTVNAMYQLNWFWEGELAFQVYHLIYDIFCRWRLRNTRNFV